MWPESAQARRFFTGGNRIVERKIGNSSPGVFRNVPPEISPGEFKTGQNVHRPVPTLLFSGSQCWYEFISLYLVKSFVAAKPLYRLPRP
jgi:hypothetical protein